MGGKNNGLFPAHLPDELADFMFLIRIQPVGRFIENQHLRIMNDGLRETGAMPVSLGEGVHVLMQDGFEETEVDDPVDGGLPGIPAQAANLGGKIQKARHGHVRIRKGVFGQVTDINFLAEIRMLRDVKSPHGHGPARGWNKTGDHPHGG